MIALGAESIRAEVHECEQYTVSDRRHIDALDDATLEAAINAAVDDHFWAAYDGARSDAIQALLGH